MRWSVRRGRSTPVEAPEASVISGLRVLIVPLVAGVTALFVMKESTWDRAADIARDETKRTWVVGAVVALAALGWPLFKKLSTGAIAVATALATVLGALFLLVPNLAPPAISSFEFKNFAVEYGVTLRDYTKHYPVKSLLEEGGWRFPEEPDRALSRIGTVVLFEAEVKGQADQKIDVRWTLFDATKRKRLAESTEIDPLCIYRVGREPDGECLSREPSRQDADIAGFELWVDTARYKDVKCFFTRLEARHRGSRLTAEDSPTFASESASRDAADACENRAPAG
jgi:hypothetical protein